MKAICTPIALLALSLSHAAFAQGEIQAESEPVEPSVEVIARDDTGKATRVSVNGREYALCSESVQDSCISPRSAGFDWGRVELDHWPGQTSTSLKQEGTAAPSGASIGQASQSRSAPPAT
ncbi:hypothetical protein [Altererythrobacter sp. GH1-8]|uniref:hypothetical protein n=1 Tax=Altererythrobacter sp. GH1-8 TaxID=3349333 RepID=UPI00374DA8D9